MYSGNYSYYPSKTAGWPSNPQMATRYNPQYKSQIVMEKVNTTPGYAGYSGRTPNYNTYVPFGFSNAAYRPFGYINRTHTLPAPLPCPPPPQPIVTMTTTTVPAPTKTTTETIETVTEETVVMKPFKKRRYRILGYTLAILAIITFGIEVADLAVTPAADSNYPYCNPRMGSSAITIPWFFSWIAPGIWASIPIFVAGVLAIRVSNYYGRMFQALAIFGTVSAFFFAPAIIAISAAEEATFSSACSYTVDNTSSSTMQAKLILPIILIILGIILLLLLLYLTLVMCFEYEYRGSNENVVVAPTTTVVPAPVPATETVMLPMESSGQGRLIMMEAHNRGYAMSNVPGYFTNVPPTTNTSAAVAIPTLPVLPAPKVDNTGFYWM